MFSYTFYPIVVPSSATSFSVYGPDFKLEVVKASEDKKSFLSKLFKPKAENKKNQGQKKPNTSFLKRIFARRTDGASFVPKQAEIPQLANAESSSPSLAAEINMQEELKAILQCHQKCLEFQEYLKAKFCPENLNFWIDVELFKKETNQDVITQQAQAIYAKYLNDNAEQQVNLDSATVKKIIGEMSGTIGCTIFDAAQLAVFKIMETDCVPRFLNKQYSAAAAIKTKNLKRTESEMQISRFFKQL